MPSSKLGSISQSGRTTLRTTIWDQYLELATLAIKETLLPQRDSFEQLGEHFHLRRSSIERLCSIAQPSIKEYLKKMIYSTEKRRSLQAILLELNSYGMDNNSNIQFFPATCAKANVLSSMSESPPKKVTITVGVCPGPMRVDLDGVLAYYLAAIELAAFFRDLKKSRNSESANLCRGLLKIAKTEAFDLIRSTVNQEDIEVQVVFKVASHLSTIKVEEIQLEEMYDKCLTLKALAKAAVVYATNQGIHSHVEEDTGIINNTIQLCKKIDFKLLKKAFDEADVIENVLRCLTILKITQFSLDGANSADRALHNVMAYIYGAAHIDLFDKLSEKNSSHVQIQWGGRHELLYSNFRELLMQSIPLSTEEKEDLLKSSDSAKYNSGLVGLNWNFIAYNTRDSEQEFGTRLKKNLSSSELANVALMKAIASSEHLVDGAAANPAYNLYVLARENWVSQLASNDITRILADVHETLGHLIGYTSLTKL